MLLPAGQTNTAFAYNGVVPFGHTSDKIICSGKPGIFYGVLFRKFWIAKGDIPVDGIRE
ncbi:hypothetical protein D3C77_763020 [compost metagenome]